ncbi:MAG: phage holin family protein [Burkholderia gladioli]
MQILIRHRWRWLALVWPLSAWAASVTFTDDLANIPFAAVAMCLFLSFIGGLASTLQKLAAQTPAARSLWLEIAKDLVVSLVAGLLAFFVSEWMNFQAVLEAGVITLAGYGGSRVLDRLLDRALREVDNNAGAGR